MRDSSPQGRLSRAVDTARAQWDALGGFGHISVAGIALSMALAVTLGFVIPALVRDNLIQSRIDTFSGVGARLHERGLIPGQGSADSDPERLGDEIDLQLLGGDTLRVKLWSPEGEVLYSDSATLIGQTFAPSAARDQAFAGDVTVRTPDLERPENAQDRDLGPLREFYIPVVGQTGAVAAVFEVYEDSRPLDATVASTRRIVWASIAVGLSILLLFIISLGIANARVMTGRTREAERQLTALVAAREDERHRIVGSLHDDIGQPLYRVLMGIQGSRSQLESDSPVGSELERLEDLLRNVDGTLRTELRLLHHGSVEQLGLGTLLEELAERTTAETDLVVSIDLEEHDRLPVPHRAALFRAAREGVTNARKHSGARTVTITVRNGAGRVLLDVEDDGRGMTGAPGLGLATTRERLEAIGGGLTVTHRRGVGTLFRAWVPTDNGDGLA